MRSLRTGIDEEFALFGIEHKKTDRRSAVPYLFEPLASAPF